MANIGILALQGDFEKHAHSIEKLGHEALFVKDIQSLDKCDRLIIPGGESTTFMKLIDRLELREPLTGFCKTKPVFGTCAGLIVLSSNVLNASFKPLNVINLVVERNAYGRQIDSFIDEINLNVNGSVSTFEAVFIRAPKIKECLNDTVPIAYHGNDIVMAANKNILVATFHPELTDDLRIHDFFLNHFTDNPI